MRANVRPRSAFGSWDRLLIGHRSLANQWIPFRDGLNVRSTFRFNVRANIAGAATLSNEKCSASITACHAGGIGLGLWELGDVLPASFSVRSVFSAAAGFGAAALGLGIGLGLARAYGYAYGCSYDYGYGAGYGCGAGYGYGAGKSQRAC